MILFVCITKKHKIFAYIYRVDLYIVPPNTILLFKKIVKRKKCVCTSDVMLIHPFSSFSNFDNKYFKELF